VLPGIKERSRLTQIGAPLGGVGRRVHHQFNAVQGIGDASSGAEIPTMRTHAGLSRQDADVVTALARKPHDMRAEDATAAGDQNAAHPGDASNTHSRRVRR